MKVLRLSLCSIAALLPILVPVSKAQVQGTSGPQGVPHSSKTPMPTDQEQFVSYWTTETGWNSELQLRNNLSGQDLTVTPALRTAGGTETFLSPVTIKPQEVQTLEIQGAVMASAPQLIATYGSVVLRYHSASLRNLFAMLMIHNVGHSVAYHFDATGEIQDPQGGSREGIWWLPNDTASDYLVLTNQGSNPLQLDLSLYDSAGKEAKQKIVLAPRATNRLSVRQLARSAGLVGSFGGIKIYTETNSGSLDSLHVLFDEKASFSALLKMFDQSPSTTLEERDYAHTKVWTLRAPMLALTSPDSALAFPEGTVLQPQLFIRNTTNKPVAAIVRFHWRSDATSGNAQGPSLQLRPYETRRVDVAALQAANMLPKDAHWSSVTLTTNSLPDEVIAVAASYSATLQYGAQTPFSDQLAFAWEGSLWEYDSQHNSLITAGNGGTKPTQAAFTMFYNRGTQRYDLEQTLQPDEQMWVDVGKLIREHIPDKNGSVLPADLTSGTYEFRDLSDKSIGSLFEGKVIYDKTYGHVTYGCAGCCAYQGPYLGFDPLGIPFLGGSPNDVWATQTCTGIDNQVGGFHTWSTANANIATVDSNGFHSGMAMGSTTSLAKGLLLSSGPRSCPNLAVSAGGGDNVRQDLFTVGYAAFIPVDHVLGPTGCTWAGTIVQKIYMGDGNRGTYRAAEEVQFIPDLKQYNYFTENTGFTRNYGKGSPGNGSTLSYLDEDNIRYDCWLWNDVGQALANFNFDTSYPYAHQGQIHYTGAVANPLENSGATILWDMRVVVDDTSPTAPTAYVNYNHTCYPAHQIKVNGAVIYLYDPPSNSTGQIFTCLVLHDYKLIGQTAPTGVTPN